jgi:hypothetical protein
MHSARLRAAIQRVRQFLFLGARHGLARCMLPKLQRLRVDIDHAATTYSLVEGKQLMIHHEGEEITVFRIDWPRAPALFCHGVLSMERLVSQCSRCVAI